MQAGSTRREDETDEQERRDAKEERTRIRRLVAQDRPHQLQSCMTFAAYPGSMMTNIEGIKALR
jgi:hypothetical protein